MLQRKLNGTEIDASSQLARIETGIGRCENIITQLLDYSRTQALHQTEVDLVQWLPDMLAEDALQLPADVTLNLHLNAAVLKADIESDRLRRALHNLILNAAEALVGKDKVVGRMAQIDIRLSLTARGVEIMVKDNGPGIPPETLARIGEPLFTTKSFGTGLGVAAVRKVMELMEGGLEITSQPGVGSTFTLWFPQQQASKHAA